MSTTKKEKIYKGYKGYKDIKGNVKIKVMFAHSIKGCHPLGRTCGVLIPSPCVNTTPEPFHLKVRRSRIFRFFRRFPQINVGGDSARIPFVEYASRESRVALTPKGRLRHSLIMQRCFHLISGVSRNLTDCASIFFCFPACPEISQIT